MVGRSRQAAAIVAVAVAVAVAAAGVFVDILKSAKFGRGLGRHFTEQISEKNNNPDQGDHSKFKLILYARV